MSVNKFRLIEEVRKRPLLWDCRNLPIKRNKNKCAAQWAEIAQILNVNESECKHAWTSLRAQFRNEASRIPKRIAKAKSSQMYYPHEKYCRWRYFDALRFLVHGITDKATFHQNFSFVSKRMESIKKHQTETELCNSNTFHTETGVKLLEYDHFNQMQNQTPKYIEDHYNTDNDIEIILDEDLDHQENYLDDNFLPKESENTNSINPVGFRNESTTKPTNLKTYTVSISSFMTDNQCAAVCNNNPDLQSNSVKEKPELQIKTENLLKELNTNEHEELEQFISSTAGSNDIKVEHPASTAFPEEQISSAPDLNDEDYSFLYSFLSQTKIMTQIQKRELHVKMKNLLLNIFPASASVKILEKQLLLPEDNDPDKKFLTSFWPFIKTMSFMQNLHFRAKMADLVLQILSSEAI